jgi:hypothetical protein
MARSTVVAANNELHTHANLAARPHHDPDKVRFLATWRHAIDDTRCSTGSFVICLKNKGAIAIAAANVTNFFRWIDAQSMEPLRATSAAVWQSPMSA